MIVRSVLAGLALLLGGCSTMSITPDSFAVVTKEYGQCITNTKAAPSFNNKKVTFRCENNHVLLGSNYEVKGVEYIDSAILSKREGRYTIRDREPVELVRVLHSVCQTRPVAGEGDKKIKRYYFDMKLKECRPFEWSGKGGFVPFKSLDQCEQYCNYKYQG